ncbi:hypothetical protein V9T40_010521 [Parthenolecanium corni]|uniref:Uncharacterized protein n=1 Tax=Parthenolecanium corni TaxID=536013 RepID=A0AAN9T4B9_9HEMI
MSNKSRLDRARSYASRGSIVDGRIAKTPEANRFHNHGNYLAQVDETVLVGNMVCIVLAAGYMHGELILIDRLGTFGQGKGRRAQAAYETDGPKKDPRDFCAAFPSSTPF